MERIFHRNHMITYENPHAAVFISAAAAAPSRLFGGTKAYCGGKFVLSPVFGTVKTVPFRQN